MFTYTLIIYPGIPFLDVYQEKLKHVSKQKLESERHGNFLLLTPNWNQRKCPSIDEKINTLKCICKTQYYLVI